MLGIKTREYKLILASDRFADRQAGETAFRHLLHFLVGKLDAEIDDQDEEETRRTCYLDTLAFDLQRAGFTLRVRFEEAQDEFKISLKHRAPDRYLAASQDVTSRKQKDDELKFEEDILPPFRSIFSRSNSLWFKKLPELRKFGDAVTLFPALKPFASQKTKLAKVNDLEAHEIFRKLCRIQIGEKQKQRLSVGLSYWYNAPGDIWPLVAECAFDCSTKKGDDFPLPVVEGANRLFRALQQQPGWINLGATTKTAYAYENL